MKSRNKVVLIAVCLIFVFGAIMTPLIYAAPTLFVSAPVQVSGSIPSAAAAGYAPNGFGQKVSCFLQVNQAWLVVWVQSSSGLHGSNTYDYSYSYDGATWSTAATFFTGTIGLTAPSQWSLACASGFSYVTIVEDFYNGGAFGNPYYFTVALTNIVSPATITAETQVTGAPAHYVSQEYLPQIDYDASGNFYIMEGAYGGGCTTNCFEAVWLNGALSTEYSGFNSNFAGVGADALAGVNMIFVASTASSSPMTSWFTGTQTTTNTYASGMGAYWIASNGTTFISSTGGLAASSTQCQILNFNTVSRLITPVTPSGLSATACGGPYAPVAGVGNYGNNPNGWLLSSPTSGTLWAIFTTTAGTSGQYVTTSSGTTGWGTAQSYTQGTAKNVRDVSGIAIFAASGISTAIAVEEDSSKNVYAQLFSSSATSASASNTQTIGSCPTKNTATFTPANNTIYLYSGNALGTEVVNTISTAVASVTSGTHTLQLLVYVSTTPTVNSISPLNLAFSRSISVTTGTVNQVITIQVNVQLGGLTPMHAGNTWAVGLVADDHFRINQSSLSGLTTLTGNPSTSTQPLTFSTLGTANVNKIYLCATASFQTSTTSTTTVTSTQAATTSVTVTNTISSTVLVNQANPATASFWFIPLMFLMLPTGIFLGVAILVQGRRR